tara:strand:+ start:774 stop:1166 length:393 start_codon:yes stop_codon:yes gene_type:complete
MILDIEKYPEFVPWCIDGKIHEKNESKDLIEIKGDLKVGKKFLNETYTSLVLYHKNKDKIIVTNINGPLKHLQNEWRFKEINHQTQLEFDIKFELKNNLFNTIMSKSFNLGLNKIADAFEKRAIYLFKDT